jgi:monofunctional biosynthetic peptidoglycan transglycosylase
MATGKTTRQRRSRSAAAPAPASLRRVLRAGWRWAGRIVAGWAAFVLFLIAAYTVINPPVTMTMIGEWLRLGRIDRDWVALEEMNPVAARSVVAAEDANFCAHWGFDMAAIRQALDEGANRGASTISQQVAKNVFLWQGRSWARKALEALLTPVVELVWTKRRIVEVYLNVAEMGPGIFGIEAAAQHYFGVAAADLSPAQAARIAAALPDPKDRDPGNPSRFLRNRASQIADGAATILADGRARCFED